MDDAQIEARIRRMNDAFDKCVNGTKESSVAAFGVDSFPALIGKKFYFFVKDSYILNDDSGIDPDEAFLGQVTGVIFRFLKDGLKVPDGKSREQHISEAKTIVELDQTCFVYIQTTLGELSPPWDGGDWCLEPEDGAVEDGSVIFL